MLVAGVVAAGLAARGFAWPRAQTEPVAAASTPAVALPDGALPDGALAAPQPQEPVAPAPFSVRGALRLRWRGRATNDESDQDAYASLALDGGDSARDAWTWRLDAQAIGDLDGRSAAGSGFGSIADAEGGDVRGYVYEAYAERHDAPEFASLRVGRQTDWETPVLVAFDGVRAVTRPGGRARAELGGFGGATVRQHADDVGGDPLLGLWGSWRPWRSARLRLDWLHVEDDERFGAEQDDLLQLALGQGLGEHARVDASWSRLEGSDRDVRVRAAWSDAERDLAVLASWTRLFETQGVLARELDPFSDALLELEPYWEGRVTVSKGFGTRWRASAGAELRRLVDDGDEGLYNHEYERVWATTTLARLPFELELALTGERWDGGGDGVDTWGADLSRRFDDGAQLSIGTAYALYRLDLFQLEEREDVRTWFARWREKRGAGWSWDLGYEYEDDPGQDLQTLRVGGTWTF
ncbi:MAG: hypothetical protein IPJ77_06860 [Planctomycetes bacterium]|nr:hypothetical protein [Planctomycetota bacterium]